MKKHFLSSAAIFALMATAAFANGNISSIDQTGDANDALIQQDGSGNNAGSDIGQASATSILQAGNGNDLDIEQTGNRNRAGAAGGIPGQARRFQQLENNNTVDLLQDGNANQVTNLTQVGGTTGAPSTNEADILQESNRNSIQLIIQRFRGGAGDAPNQLSLRQTGGNENTIVRALQTGASNDMDVSQEGRDNRIFEAIQLGVGNDTDVKIDGNLNGNDGAGSSLGFPSAGVYAGTLTSVTSVGRQRPLGLSSITTVGDRNDVGLSIIGNRTAFGIAQNGDDNETTGISINGNDNAFSSDQFGDRNMISMAFVMGTGNSLGIAQEGDDNIASANIDGVDNNSRLTQLGNDNDTSLAVVGNFNTATLDVTGDNNLLDAEQIGSRNVMDVDVFGSGNNAAGFSAGDAGTARNAARTALGSNAFGQGDLWQHGSGNTMTVAVGASGTDSDDNAFAALQFGNGNVISGTIGGGDFNQAVVAQLSNNNTATFTQAGNGNNLGVTQ